MSTASDARAGSGTIAVIDYGMGNLRSVWQALVHVAQLDKHRREVVVTADPDVVAKAERVVFPGQGAMPDCMRELGVRGLRESVIAAARDKPFLGICIGLQMLFEHSEEGDVAGLGVFAGPVRRFPAAKMFGAGGEKLKVPHMGWNEVMHAGSHPLLAGIADVAKAPRFYFVHSYYVDPVDRGVVAATSDYGIPFTSAVARDNIFAIQCHPEKSAQAGLALLSNFIAWKP